MADTVGTIALGLELQTNLDKDLEKVGQSIAKGITGDMSQMMRTIFGSITEGLQKELGTMDGVIDKTLETVSRKVEATTEKMTASIAAIDVNQATTAKAEKMQAAQSVDIPVAKVKVPEIKAPPVDNTKWMEYLYEKAELTGQKIGVLENKLAELDAYYSRIQDHISRGSENDVMADIIKTKEQINKLRLTLEQTWAAYDKAKEGAEGTAEGNRELANSAHAATLSQSKINTIASTIRKAGNAAGNAAGKIRNKLLKSLKDLGGSASRNALNALGKLHIGFNKLGGDLGDGIKNFNVAGFSVSKLARAMSIASIMTRMLRASMRKLVKSMFDVLKTNDSLMASLTATKDNLEIAFYPVYSFVLPALEALAAAAERASAAIATAMNAIFKTTTAKSAAAVNAIRKKTAATKEDTKATKELAKATSSYLAGFDEINNITTQTSGTSGSDAANEAENAIKKITKIPLDKRIRDLINKGDWEGLGKLFASKLNKITDSGDKWINSKFRPFAKRFTSHLADFMNGAVKVFNFRKLGKTVADGMNAVFDAWNTFLKKFKARAAGKGIGNAIKGWFDNIEWGLIGETFGRHLDMLWQIAGGAVSVFVKNAEEWGKDVAEAVNSFFKFVNLRNIGNTIKDAFNSVTAFLSGLVKNTDWEGIRKDLTESINSMLNGIKIEDLMESINAIISNLLEMARDADWERIGYIIGTTLASLPWADILQTAAKAILEGLIGAIKGFFANGSIGDKLSFIGIMVVPSLLKLGGTIGSIFAKSMLENAATNIAATGFSGIISSLSGVIPAIASFLTGPVGIGIAIAAAVALVIYLLYKYRKEILSVLSNIWEGIKGIFSNVASFFADVFGAAAKAIKNAFSGVASFFKNLFNDIVSTFKGFINGAIDGLNTIIGALNKIHFKTPDWMPGIGGKSVGFNLSKVPKLANGGFVEANTPRLAMIGDNRHEGEIVTPEGKMHDVVRSALEDYMSQNTENNAIMVKEVLTVLYLIYEELKAKNLTIDADTLTKEMNKRNQMKTLRTG